MVDGNGKNFGIPSASNVGTTITGQSLFPVFNNNGGYTPEKCEVDSCQSHVGQGGGPPHIHGDPFGATCLYSISNYSTLDVHPPLIGFAVDGYLIYGRHMSPTAVGASTVLDLCGGHDHDSMGYHYHTQVLMMTSGSTGGNNAITKGLPYPISTTGPYFCFKGDLLATDSYWGSIRGPINDQKTQMCTGMTNYYLQQGFLLTGAGEQSTAGMVASAATSSSLNVPAIAGGIVGGDILVIIIIIIVICRCNAKRSAVANGKLTQMNRLSPPASISHKGANV
jgi:hypothetical protein